jgi:uncharacterized DUF497 family protein
MRVTYDPEKRERTLQERGLDFEDAKFAFSGATLEVEYTRKKYGEARIICFGYLAVVWLWSATRRVARFVTFSA